MPVSVKGSITLRMAFAHGIKVGSWNTNPRAGSAAPPTVYADVGQSIVPALGTLRPAIRRNRVDLPQPEGPRTLMNSPALTSRSTPRMASVPFENCFDTLRIDTSGRPSRAAVAAAPVAAVRLMLQCPY